MWDGIVTTSGSNEAGTNLKLDCCCNISNNEQAEKIRQNLLLDKDNNIPMYMINLTGQSGRPLGQTTSKYINNESLLIIRKREWLDFTCLCCYKINNIPMCSGTLYDYKNTTYFTAHSKPFFSNDIWVNKIYLNNSSNNQKEHILWGFNWGNIKESFNGKGLRTPEKYIIFTTISYIYCVWLWLCPIEHFPVKLEYFNMTDSCNDKRGLCMTCIKSWEQKGLVTRLCKH